MDETTTEIDSGKKVLDDIIKEALPGLRSGSLPLDMTSNERDVEIVERIVYVVFGDKQERLRYHKIKNNYHPGSREEEDLDEKREKTIKLLRSVFTEYIS